MKEKEKKSKAQGLFSYFGGLTEKAGKSLMGHRSRVDRAIEQAESGKKKGKK